MDLEDLYSLQLENFIVINDVTSIDSTNSEIVVLDIDYVEETNYETEQTRAYDETLRKLGIYYICKLVIEDTKSEYYQKYIDIAKTNGSDLFKLVKTELDSGKTEKEVIPVVKEEIIKTTSKIIGHGD
jgi:hypothetical protein